MNNLSDEVSLLRERVRQLEATLRPESIMAYSYSKLRLSTQEAQFLAILLTRNHICTREQLYSALYFDYDEDESPTPKILDVIVCKLRKKLRRVCDGKIDTIWGRGYVITTPNKELIAAALGVPLRLEKVT